MGCILKFANFLNPISHMGSAYSSLSLHFCISGASTRCDVDLNPESSAPPSGRPSWRSLDSSDTGFGAVGKVVEVYWEGESEWFRGRLTRYRDADGKHRVDYDDGESEWLVLAKNSVRFPEGDLVTFTSPVKKEIRRLRDNLNSSEFRRDLEESRSEFQLPPK